MPTLSVAVPHALGQQEATDRLKGHLGDVKDRFGRDVRDLVEQWDGHVLSYRFTTFGIPIQGTVTAGESDVKVSAELPFAAMMFRKTIEQQIRDRLEKILA